MSTDLISNNPLQIIESMEADSKKTPSWLIELSRTVPNDNNQLPRPSTDNSHSNLRPKWFEELNQKRRMSDFGGGSSDCDQNIFKINPFSIENKSSSSMLSMSSVSSMNSPLLPMNPDRFATEKDIKILNSDDSDSIQLIKENRPTIEIIEIPSSPSLSSSSSAENDLISDIFSDRNNMVRSTSMPIKSAINNYFDQNDSLISLNPKLNDPFVFKNFHKSIENLSPNGDTLNTIEEECIIPEMPIGNELIIIMLENWGDKNFLGLNGIEILDRFGNRPAIKKISLENQYSQTIEIDSGNLQRLIDNTYRTHDDAHIWQHRIGETSLPVQIRLRFERITTIALIRIWNLNKSRVHSYGGVRLVKFLLDDQTIFFGEIAKANGNLNGSLENFGDVSALNNYDQISN
ncbi:Rab11 family-interacting protein 4A [Sarcoptes scabiei]|nr:Rab11 family-interacting protein 4A [Sarcoptes scabiei]